MASGPHTSYHPGHSWQDSSRTPPQLPMNLRFPRFADQNAQRQRFRYLHPINHSPFLRPSNNMAAHNHDEMEEFQRLSDRYQPDLEGPLVSQRLPIGEVVAEYAQADPAFVTKTRALAGIYDTYRRIKGDGQCGWRGTVFGYFELLARAGDVSLLEVEEIRIRTFQDIMTMAGVDYELLVDMFDNTWELFAEIRKAIQNNNVDESLVLNVMNDPVVSESIIYHFKMMTSSYMALHTDDFEPFLEMSLDEYRQTRIDPTNQEIDQIGLQALTSGVIAPGGIGLEVLYLDRSAGEAVTPHAFVPDAEDKPNIRLLYRPGHYDIIYKNNSPLAVMLQWNTQAVRTGGDYEQPADFYSFMFPYSTDVPDPHPDPPDNGRAPDAGQYHSQSLSHQFQHEGPIGSLPQPAQYETSINNFSYQKCLTQPGLSGPTSVYQTQLYQAPAAQEEYFSLPQRIYTTSSSSPSIPTNPPPPAISPNEPQIRLNPNMFKPDYGRFVAVPLDPRHVGSFATSTAHFCNSDFQPEIWNAKNGYNK